METVDQSRGLAVVGASDDRPFQQAKGVSMKISREELYDLVWSEPTRAIGARFGVSDVALAKTCKRMKIPKPGRGYWQLREVGKAPRRRRLPKLPPGERDRLGDVEFGRVPKPAPDPEAELGPVADQARHEANPKNRIRTAMQPWNPHPVARQTREWHEAANCRPSANRHRIP